MDWQPIETAPKDGSEILLCKATDADGNPIGDIGLFCQVASFWGDDGWMVYCSIVHEPSVHFTPTHWMPLPKPPVNPIEP